MDNGKNSSETFYNPSAHTVESRPNSLYVGREPPKVMRQGHWHAQVEVNFMVSGTLDYRIGRQVLRLRQGEMILFWGGMNHQTLSVSNDADYVCIHLPLTDFFRVRLPLDVQSQVIDGTSLISVLNDPADSFNFVRWANALRFGPPALVENALDEVLLRIERSQFGPYHLSSSGEPPSIDATSIDADFASTSARVHIAHICNFIGANFREEIHAADVAAAADLHPKYAMNVFKKSTGMTLNRYITLLRLSYAQAMLTNGAASVTEIAMDSGFSSLSAFNKSFAKQAGKTPSDFRRDSHALVAPTGVRERVASGH